MDNNKSELNLGCTEEFSARANEIRSALSPHLKVGQPQIYFMRSADLTPSFIQLLGDVGAWQVLKAAAAVFLTAFVATLGKRTADATWDKIVNKEEVKPLTAVAKILAESIKNEWYDKDSFNRRMQSLERRIDNLKQVINQIIEKDVDEKREVSILPGFFETDFKTLVNNFIPYICIGLNIPDDKWGTCLRIKSFDPERVVYELATFLVHVEPLSKAMEEEIAAGRRPLGPANIEIQEDGSLLVKWVTQDGKPHEIQIKKE